MDEIRAFIEQVGQWANSNDFANGILLLGGAATATTVGAYRLLRGKKKEATRIKATIDAPAGTRIKFESGEDAVSDL